MNFLRKDEMIFTDKNESLSSKHLTFDLFSLIIHDNSKIACFLLNSPNVEYIYNTKDKKMS